MKRLQPDSVLGLEDKMKHKITFLHYWTFNRPVKADKKKLLWGWRDGSAVKTLAEVMNSNFSKHMVVHNRDEIQCPLLVCMKSWYSYT